MKRESQSAPSAWRIQRRSSSATTTTTIPRPSSAKVQARIRLAERLEKSAGISNILQRSNVNSPARVRHNGGSGVEAMSVIYARLIVRRATSTAAALPHCRCYSSIGLLPLTSRY